MIQIKFPQVPQRKNWLTTHNDSRILVQAGQHEVKNITTDIVEVNVKIFDDLLEICQERWAFVVEGLLDAAFLLQPLALFFRPCDCIDFGTHKLTQLACDSANRTSSTRDNKSFTRLEFANVLKTLSVQNISIIRPLFKSRFTDEIRSKTCNHREDE